MAYVLWGCFGGLLGNLIRLVQVANTPKQQRPPIVSDPWYHLQVVILAIMGGVFVLMYHVSGVQLNAILSVNVGASAPIIAQNFLASVPKLSPGKTD